MRPRVAVVLASFGPRPGFEASVAAFVREVEGLGQVILVESGGNPRPRPREGTAGLRWFSSPDSRLVPELWRDGLRRADAECIAFSTTQMVPRTGWLRSLLDRMEATGAWGVGGAIEAGPNLGPIDRAIYLQRFLNYAPGCPLPTRPSGENALYRKDRLDEVAEAWSGGFWEAEVQPILERRGATWAAEPGARVEYVGAARLFPTLKQRIAHARRYGSTRAGRLGRAGRLARGIAAPAVPAVLLGRAGRGLRRRELGLGPWLGAVPGFLAIAGAWSVGEVFGMLDARDR